MSNRACLFPVHLFQSKPSFYQEKGSQLKRDFIKIWRYSITAHCKSTEQVWPIITNAWLQRLFTGGQGSSVLLFFRNERGRWRCFKNMRVENVIFEGTFFIFCSEFFISCKTQYPVQRAIIQPHVRL